MKGFEFLRRIQRLGKRKGVHVRLELHQGKGSHARLWYGERWATLKDRKKEIGPGLLKAMCTQLGIDVNDL